MDLTIAVLSVFMVLHLGSGQTPPRPNLSNSYSAEVHVTIVELGQFSLYQFTDMYAVHYALFFLLLEILCPYPLVKQPNKLLHEQP